MKKGAFLSWGEEDWLVSWGEWQSEGPWFIGEFYSDVKRRAFANTRRVSKKSFLELLQAFLKEVTPSRKWQEPKKAGFSQQLKLIFEAIESKQFQKAVPVVYEVSEGNFKEGEKIKSLIKLLENKGTQYAYGHWSDDCGIMGLTPELLFEIEDKKLKTMALAGSRSKDQKFSLLEDQKERLEHQFVIDRMSTVLSQFNKVKVGETLEAEFGDIVHLKTLIEMNIEEAHDISELCNQLHPTPALGVFSEAVDHHWLKKLDEFSCEKLFFGAPFGVYFEGKTRIVVGIRNIQWHNGQTFLGSGCGIVKESLKEKEWAELALKRKTVKKALGL